MKKSLISLLFALLATSGMISAQNCADFYAMKAGRKMVIANYSAKDKLEGYNNTEILKVTETGDGMVADLKTSTTNDKGKEEGNFEYTVACKGGSFYMNMRAAMAGQMEQQMQGMENMELSIESDDMLAPAGLPGATLPDCQLTMNASMNGMSIMSMNVRIFNRKIEAIENMTCPAGTFKCIKYSEDVESKSMFTVKGHSVGWFCPEAGMVRVESYDSKGELTGYQVLQSLE